MKTPALLIIIALLVLSSNKATAQFFSKTDSAEEKIIQQDCDDIIFTKVETPASLKKGIKAFEDTLTSCLRSKNAFKDAKITFRFLLTARSHIFDLVTEKGRIDNEYILTGIIQQHAAMWKNAVQNDMQVCSYVYLEIEIANEKLTATIK